MIGKRILFRLPTNTYGEEKTVGTVLDRYRGTAEVYNRETPSRNSRKIYGVDYYLVKTSTGEIVSILCNKVILAYDDKEHDTTVNDMLLAKTKELDELKTKKVIDPDTLLNEKNRILYALSISKFRKDAAKLLGMTERTLYRKLRHYNIPYKTDML